MVPLQVALYPLNCVWLILYDITVYEGRKTRKYSVCFQETDSTQNLSRKHLNAAKGLQSRTLIVVHLSQLRCDVDCKQGDHLISVMQYALPQASGTKPKSWLLPSLLAAMASRGAWIRCSGEKLLSCCLAP